MNAKNLQIPHDLQTLSFNELDDLATDIREYLIHQISKTGGHIGANLGTIELTLALHYCFKSPEVPLLFDTGHIGYTHKLLTGRQNLFDSLNTYGGMNRFLTPSESEHDIIEASHAGTAISIGLGIALARKVKQNNTPVIAIVGDSALAEGSSFEALNHAVAESTNLITVINDNGYAISPGFGGLHNLLSSGVSRSEPFFNSLGMNYLGPVNGHNIEALVDAFKESNSSSMPTLVHAKTIKGKGWKPADNHPFRMHFSFPYNVDNGTPLDISPPRENYTDVVGKKIEQLMSDDEDIICITPSTIYATGLADVFKKFPERCFDPGMEEQHALSMTVGFAIEGCKPIIAFQSTFMQRAFDQLLHDVCFSNLPTLILSMRSGFSGYDNPTHHGIYDISFLKCMPNLTVLYPKDQLELSAMIDETIKHLDSPTLIMMPYGPTESEPEKNISYSKIQHELTIVGKDILIITVGNKYYQSKDSAKTLGAGLLNLGILQPLDEEFLVKVISQYEYIITVEEAILDGGMGSAIASLILDNKLNQKHLRIGLPKKFIEPGSNEELEKIYGLDSEGITASIRKFIK